MFRRVFLAVALILSSTGCDRGDVARPFAESRTPPDLSARFFMPEAWAWGYLQVGNNPPQRYGVASTWRAPRATILILPDTGECAEAWFETATELTLRSYSVWVLDRAAECGSGRQSSPRDRIHVRSFDPDVAAVKSLLRIVIRPNGETPVILLGQGQGAVLALRAVETGLTVDGLVLSSPTGAMPPKWTPWSRSGQDLFQRGRTHDPQRGHVTQSWMTANPDLRGSGPSPEWLKAAALFVETARNSARGLDHATLILTPGPAPSQDLELCGAINTCAIVPVSGAYPALNLEADTWRKPWLDAIIRFIAGKADAARRVGPDRFAPALPLVPGPVSEDLRPGDVQTGTGPDGGP